jgi:hypothetical protein
MPGPLRRYFENLAEAAGEAWNRWWFTPRDAAHLGGLRIALGAIVLYWLATLSPDLVLLFGPDGLLPAEVVLHLMRLTDPAHPGQLSLLLWLRSPAALWTAHAAALVIAMLFTAGLFTRVASVLTLVVFLTYVHRAPMITGIVEWVLAFALFYLCLAPCGRYYSVDAWRRSTADARQWPSLSANVSTRLLQIHTAIVYGMMGITMLASPNQTWWYGEAVWYLIARPESRMVDLTWLADQVSLINFWSHWIVFYELAFCIFIWNRWARPLILAAGVPHWLALAVISGQAPFCLTMLALNLAFVSRRADGR